MSLFERLAAKAVQKAVSETKIPPKIARHMPIARRILSGDIDGAIDQAVSERFGLARTGGPMGEGWARVGGPSRLLGGITPKRVKQIYQQMAGIEYAKKNLWVLRITDLRPQRGDEFSSINLFAVDVAHSQYAINSNDTRLGSGHFNVPDNGAPVEVRVTSLDDSYGSVKRWFRDRHLRVCRPDGTHGLPINYLMLCEIVHAVIDEVEDKSDAYADRIICRAGSIETDLSRSEDALQQLQFSLVEHDSFLPT